MKTYFTDFIPKIQRFSEKLDNLTLLTNQHWVLLDKIDDEKKVYLFRDNNELLISTNGKVIKGRWEYLGNKSLLIDHVDSSYLFKHGFFDQNVLALKIDSKQEYAVFVNENNYEGELNTLEKAFDFLKRKYLSLDHFDTLNKSLLDGSSKNLAQNESIQIVTKKEKDENNKRIFNVVFWICVTALIYLFFVLCK